jgi:16S rRNA (cytosine967-C5)-methyltransferase
LPEENDRRVAAFLAAHAAFQAVPPADVVARAGLDAGLANAALTSDRGLLLTPHRTGTDGFFVAVMARG